MDGARGGRAPHHRAGLTPISCRAMSDGTWWQDGVAVPDLPPVLRGLRRRRARRPQGIARGSTTSSGSGSTAIWLSPTMPSPNDDWGYDVADYRGVAPGLRQARRPRRADRRRRARGASACCSTSSRTTRATSTRGSSRRSAPATPRIATSTCGPTRRPTAGRRTTGARPSAARRGRSTRPPGSTTCTTSCPRSPTSTGGTRTSARRSTTSCASGSTAGSRASASTSRTRSSRTASCATTRGPPRTTTSSVRERGLRQVYSMNRPEVPRRAAPLAHGRGRRDAAEPILIGETYVLDIEQLIPFYGAGADELHLAFNFLFVARRPRRREDARRSSSRRRRCCPRAPGRCGRGPTTTRAASRRAGPAATSAARAARAHAAAHPARDAVPLLRRRDRA